MSNQQNSKQSKRVGLVVLTILVTSLFIWYYLDDMNSKTKIKTYTQIHATKQFMLHISKTEIANHVDSWGNKIRILEGKDEFDDTCVLLTSAGPDGVFETGDDIECLRWIDELSVRLSRRPARAHMPVNQSWQVILEENSGSIHREPEHDKMAKSCFYRLMPDGNYVKRN